jgi:hypothetical protein
MGKAARKRLKGQSRYLAKIAQTRPELFAEKWDKRLDSWLTEIQLSIAEWKRGGDASHECVFEMVENALEILETCGPVMYNRHAKHTCDVLCDACCTGAAGILDPRLYALSNYKSLENMAKE